MNCIFYLKFKYKFIFLKKKHDILTGVGSCARNGTTDGNTYYCGSGPECNNFVGKTCWNPVGNATSPPCTSSQWQCQVKSFFLVIKSDDCIQMNITDIIPM